jgi:hypothetical protein
MFSRKALGFIAVGASSIAIGGGTYGLVSATTGNGSGSATTATARSAPTGRAALGGRGSNARSGPAAGGTSGTVDSVSGSSFTVSTSAGQTVTVNMGSSTGDLEKGESVLVLGTVDGTTITASQVIAQPAGADRSSVVPFQRGARSTAQQVGQIPATYKQGSGTIVSGTTADEATKAALAAYPGGIVDRVVKLSNGEFEVHNIGVNWPHHIFVNQDFKVVGAN